MNRKRMVTGLIAGLVFSCFVGVGNVYCDSAEEHFRRGNAYKANGEYHEAIAEFKKFIQILPGVFEAYTNVGLCYNDLSEYQQAISYFQKAIQINPNDYMTYDGMGVSYHHLGDFQQSINCYKNSIRIKPNNALAHNNLGLAYDRLGQYEEARKCLQKAKELYQSQGDYQEVQEIENFLNLTKNLTDQEFKIYYDFIERYFALPGMPEQEDLNRLYRKIANKYGIAFDKVNDIVDRALYRKLTEREEEIADELWGRFFDLAEEGATEKDWGRVYREIGNKYGITRDVLNDIAFRTIPF